MLTGGTASGTYGLDTVEAPHQFGSHRRNSGLDVAEHRVGKSGAVAAPPLRSSMEESWLGGLLVDPHIVNVGQTVSMTIGDPSLWTKSCLGMNPQHPKCIESISWAIPQFGKKVGGCGDHDTSCDWAPTVGPDGEPDEWLGVSVGINATIGTGISQDYYVVLPSGRAVSGYVQDSNGKGVADVRVDAVGPTPGSATTNRDGFYDISGLAPGSYRVRPSSETATVTQCDPGSRSGSSCELDLSEHSGVASFQPTGLLQFKVVPGTDASTLVQAGSSFTEQVTLKDTSLTKTVVVAPIYPQLSGNAEGGALQPPDAPQQHSGAVSPSPIVLLHPGEQQTFESAISTTASRMLGTDDGDQKASGGTRAYVRFALPRAFVLTGNDQLNPVAPDEIDVAEDLPTRRP